MLMSRGENIDTITKNTEPVLVASKQVGLEVYPEKTEVQGVPIGSDGFRTYFVRQRVAWERKKVPL
jgi:hypothetical protein